MKVIIVSGTPGTGKTRIAKLISKKYVNLCIITKCNLKVLKSRLNKRKYNNLKIKENLESEIFNVCLSEALQNKHNVIVIDTSKGVKHINIKQLLIFVR